MYVCMEFWYSISFSLQELLPTGCEPSDSDASDSDVVLEMGEWAYDLPPGTEEPEPDLSDLWVVEDVVDMATKGKGKKYSFKR